VVAGGVLYLIASGKAGFDPSSGFAANGYGAHSPGGYSLAAALIAEVVMTMMFFPWSFLVPLTSVRHRVLHRLHLGCV
jgi:glycerol uptake facilitator-like aquaporin